MLGWFLVGLSLLSLPQAKSGSVGQTLAEASLADGDYAFQLSAPAGWAVLGEQEIAGLHAYAVAGLDSGSGVRGYLMLRRVPKTTLEECQNWLMDQVPIQDRTVVKRELATFAGQKALLAIGLGDLHGARMRFRLAAFLHKGSAYLLLAYGPMNSVAADGKELQPVFDAFKLESTPPKGREFPPSTDTGAGTGWTLEQGTFTHPQLGLRISAPPGWRALTRGNAALGDQLVGFASREPEALVLVGAEIIDTALHKQWSEAAAGFFDSSLDPSTLPTLKPSTLSFAGVNLPARWYRHRTDPLHHYLVGTGAKDGMCYRVAVRTLVGEEEKSAKEARTVLATAQPLPPLERAETALEMLARGEDSQSQIGKLGLLRAGRYKDIETGFLVDLPAGFWVTDLSSPMKIMDEPVRLTFRDEVRGLDGLIYVYPFAVDEITVNGKKRKRSARFYSERVIDALIGPEPGEDDEVTEKRGRNTKETPVNAGPWTLYSMSANWMEGGFKKRVVTVGHMRNDTLAILVLRGLEPAIREATPGLRRAAASFRWLGKGQGSRYVKDGRFHDDSLGVSLPLGAGDWNWVPDSTEQAFEGYLCEIKGPNIEILLFEVATGVEMPTASALARRFKRRYGDALAGIDWDKPAERDEAIGGAPAHVFDFTGTGGRVEIAIVRANGLQYGVGFVRRGSKPNTPEEFAVFKKNFAFTQPGGVAAALTEKDEAAAAEAAKEDPEEAGGNAGEGNAGADKSEPGKTDPAKPDSGKSTAAKDDKSSGKSADGGSEPDAAGDKAASQPLLLPTGWRELSVREPIAGFDLLIAFRAQPSWLEQLQASKIVEARGADPRPLFAAVRASGLPDGGCDLLAVERFAMNAKSPDAAAIEQAVAPLVTKVAGRDFAARTLEQGRLGPVRVLAWQEPPPKTKDAKPGKDGKASKAKPGGAGASGTSGAGTGSSGTPSSGDSAGGGGSAAADAPGSASAGTEGSAGGAPDDGSRHARVYLLTSGMRGWAVTVRTRRALSADESKLLDDAVLAYEPPQ
jgi:hypothetical protein